MEWASPPAFYTRGVQGILEIPFDRKHSDTSSVLTLTSQLPLHYNQSSPPVYDS